MEEVKTKWLERNGGIWKQFLALLYKGKLPWIWILMSIIVSMGVVKIGISETKYTAQLFSGDTSVRLITQLVIVMLVNWLGSGIVIVVRSLTTAKINRNLRKTVWKKLLHLPMDFFKGNSPRESVSRITTDTDSISTLFSMGIVPFITQTYTVIAILQELYGYDWRLMLTMIVVIPFAIIVTDILGKLLFTVSKNATGVSALLTEQLSELVYRLPLMKVFAQEKKEEKSGHLAVEKLYRVNLRSGWIGMIGSLSFSLVTVFQFVIMIIVGRTLLMNHHIVKADWVAFYLFSGTMMCCMEDLKGIWTNVKTIQGGTSRIAQIISTNTESLNGILCDKLSGDIKLSNVKFSYSEENTILHDLSCMFPEKKITALLGISGCGKTTILNLIMRIHSLQEGEIRIGENNILDYEVESYRKKFAVLSQDVTLFSGTIKENICYGLNYFPDDETIKTTLMDIGADYVFEYPENIYFDIGEKGEHLSGGQKQKIGIARAILSKSPYILFDEAVSALDASAVSEILTIIKRIAKERTVIMIAHSPSVLEIADRCVVVEEGKVSVEGSMDCVYQSSQFFRDFIGERRGAE